jgi:hypothetical protein
MTATRPSHLLSLSFVIAAAALVAVAMSPIFVHRRHASAL